MALMAKLFEGDACIRAFTVFNLFQNLGSAGGFYYAVPLPMHGDDGTLGQVPAARRSRQVWVQAFLLAVGALFFIYADQKYARHT